MSGPEQLPEGLLRDLVEALARHGHAVPPEDVLPAMIAMLHGGERRSSTQLIFGKLVQTFLRPAGDFTSGERHGRADDLSIITGRAISGLLGEAEAAAGRHSW